MQGVVCQSVRFVSQDPGFHLRVLEDDNGHHISPCVVKMWHEPESPASNYAIMYFVDNASRYPIAVGEKESFNSLAISNIWVQPQMPARAQADHTSPAEDPDPIGLSMKQVQT